MVVIGVKMKVYHHQYSTLGVCNQMPLAWHLLQVAGGNGPLGHPLAGAKGLLDGWQKVI